MSSFSPPFDSDRARRVRELIRSPPAELSQPLAHLAAPLRFVAFWVAVALPFLYLPLLVGGLEGGQPAAFAALLAANAVALLVGHGYGAEADT
ncbi:hypothetical protein [Halobellus ruber]|uniref:Uncharacterized protein n=1 Tax=Halobellus ruber TaxID=2761102 RepID=A0A7J9SF29_9EURY|nr:hypothetical protein [Halobellus ruber]MBB6644993.1 hypothetical protein [Halobellus ruber]